MSCRQKSGGGSGGGTGSASSYSDGSQMMQLDSDPQSVSDSNCFHTQGSGDGEVEDG